MRKIILFFVILFSLFATRYSLFAREALAVCPICTVAVGAGLGLSRYLGIDDSITGIWVGGLMISLTLWTTDWLSKKKIRYGIPLSFLFFVLLTYPPLWYAGIIGHPFNTVLGVDKLIFGSIVGGLAFLSGIWADKKIRKIRGRQLFTYQKVVFPVISLTIASLMLYYFGGYLYGLN